MSLVRGLLLLGSLSIAWGVFGGIAAAVWALAFGTEPGVVGYGVALVVGFFSALGFFALIVAITFRPERDVPPTEAPPAVRSDSLPPNTAAR